jgi:hypothetical protein
MKARHLLSYAHQQGHHTATRGVDLGGVMTQLMAFVQVEPKGVCAPRRSR